MSEPNELQGLRPGTVFGKYTILRVVGVGGMGAVYEANHADLNKRVALKVMHREMATKEDIATRFMREGAAASKIRHPNVVDMSDFGVQNGMPYLVMEFLEGESFSNLVKRENGLKPDKLVDLALPVCAAVAAAHDEGVVHRDLKPDNIFLARGRGNVITPKVVDFGISKINSVEDNNLTTTGSMLGTPAYMAPEQVRNSKYVDARSDQYSLGAILYQGITGQKPFEAETLYELMNKIVHGEIRYPRAIKPEIPEGLEKVILRAMSCLPEDRFPSVRALGRALLAYGSERSKLLWQSELSSDVSGEMDAPIVPVGVTIKRSVPPSSQPGTLAASAKEIDAPRPDTKPSSGGKGLWLGLAAVALLGGGGFTVWKLANSGPSHPTTAPIAVAPRTPTGRSTAETPPPVGTPPGPATPNAPVPPPATPTYHAHITVNPSTAFVDLDGDTVGQGTLDHDFPIDGRAHTVRAHADGYQLAEVSFTDHPPAATLTLTPAPPESQVAEAPGPSGGSPALATTADAGHHHHHGHGGQGTEASSGDNGSGGSTGSSGSGGSGGSGSESGTNGAAILQ